LNTATNPSKVVNVTYVVQSGFNFEFLNTYNDVLTATGSLSGAVTYNILLLHQHFVNIIMQEI